MIRPVVTAVVVAASATVLSGAVKFTSMWKSMDAGTVSFAGKKVAALVISQDESLRVAGEESLARELGARGMQGLPAFALRRRKELQRAGRQGVVREGGDRRSGCRAPGQRRPASDLYAGHVGDLPVQHAVGIYG